MCAIKVLLPLIIPASSRDTGGGLASRANASLKVLTLLPPHSSLRRVLATHYRADHANPGPPSINLRRARARAARDANALPAVPALPHLERTFTSVPRISLVVQSSSEEPPSQS